MLSEHYLLGNLQALAATGTPAPPLGRVDAEELRIVERDGGVALAIRAADRQWVVLADDDASDASTIPVPDVTTVCVIGTRAGKRIDDIEARSAGIRIVAIEPDPAHALILLSSRDCRDAITSGRLVVLIGPDYPGASSSARRMDTSTKPLVLTDPLLAAHREASTRTAHATLERMLSEARANDDARRAFAPRYLLQTLQNLPVIAREGDTAALDRRFAGIPAVIVGAGPSLDRHLSELKRLSDRCLIVAADTALAPLGTAGITAPVVVGVDPSEWNARHLAAPRHVDHTWLVAEGSLHPSVFARFAGRTFTFEVSGHEPWPWFRTHGLTRGRLRAWGSVITSAFDLALRLGCDPIVFAGLDLAFTGGQTYCRHTAHEEIWGQWIAAGDTWDNVWAYLVSQQPQQTMADLRGQPALTTPYLVAFRNWLVEQIAAAPQPRTFVNATGAGLLYGPRITQSTLTEVLASRPSLAPGMIGQRLAAAHHARTDPRLPLRAAAREAASSLGSAAISELEARWRRFTAGSLDSSRTSEILNIAAQSLQS